MSKPVGLLWDSVSDNVGDQAIGMVMRRFLESKGIRYEAADPFSYDSADYSILIVGGGELIRPRGDPFYDRYRVRGEHILNAMGVYQPDDVEYLNEYRLVTVRSEADKKILDPVVAGVKVRPCVTLVMGDYFEKPVHPLVPQTIIPGETIGVHVNLAVAHLIPSLVPAIRHLHQYYKVVLFPFTLYQQDGRIHEAIRKWLPEIPISPLRDPADIFHAIGQMRALVCVSLHGTIFAYAQNVPVLAFPTVPKISNFLEERGLGQYLYHTADEMLAKLENILAAPPDFSAAFAQDKRIVRKHLEEVAQIAGSSRPVRRAGAASGSLPALKTSLAEAVKAFHHRWMQYMTLWSSSFAETLEHQHAAGLNEEQIRSLQTQAGQWKTEAEAEKQAVQALTSQAAEKDQSIQALAAQAAGKDKAIQTLMSQAAEKDQSIQALTVQAAGKDQSIQALTVQAAGKDQTIQSLMAQAADKDQSIRTITAQLVDIKGSTTWNIARRLWRVQLFLAPHGSKRERIGQMILRGFLIWRTEGFVALVRKTYSKINRPKDPAP